MQKANWKLDVEKTIALLDTGYWILNTEYLNIRMYWLVDSVIYLIQYFNYLRVDVCNVSSHSSNQIVLVNCNNNAGFFS